MRRLGSVVVIFLAPVIAEAVSMSVDVVPGSCGSSVTVPVRVDSARGAVALEFRIAYDAARLSNPTVATGALTQAMSVRTQHSDGAVRVTLRAQGADTITSVSPGTIANVTFYVSGSTTGRATLALSNASMSTQLTMTAAQIADGGIDVSCSGGCRPASDALCLLSRFRVNLSARDFRTGNTGTGLSLPKNDKFGYFSIPALTFAPENPEVFVKMLDGRQSNGRFWVFYGGLTDLEYTLTITDTTNGTSKVYNKSGGNNCGNFDVSAFSKTAGAKPPIVTIELAATGAPAIVSAVKASPAPLNQGCRSATDALCLGGRFAVKLQAVNPRDGRRGTGLALPENDLFGFFAIPDLTNDPSNPEVFVKVLDGTGLNGRFWVFYGGLTDFEYTVTVTDHVTGASQSYLKEGGSACGAFDVTAFLPGPGTGGCPVPTFAMATPIVLTDPLNVSALDIDKDSRIDLAVTQFGINAVSVFRGDGRGGFALATTKTVAAGPYSVLLTDLDTDGRVDLITANLGSNTLSVFYGGLSNPESPITLNPRGNRDRTTGEAPLFAISPSRLTLWSADDRDPSASITVITECEDLPNSSPASVPRATPEACPATEKRGVGFAAGHFEKLDLGGDGIKDDVAISQYSARQLTMFSETLSFVGGYDTAGQPTVSASGDFNNDGIADLAIVNDVDTSKPGDALVSVLIGRGDGTFDRAPDLSTPGSNAGNGIAVADYNNDGNLDIVASEQRSAPNVGFFSFLWIFPGKGTGRFGDAVQIVGGARFWGIATADFNLDGRPDLALADQLQNRVAILLNSCTK